MSFWSKFKSIFIQEIFELTNWKTVRNRDEKGRFIADDKSTPDVNEAYIEVVADSKENFKDTDPVKPGVQNKSRKRAVKKAPTKKTTKTAKK